MVVLVCLTTTNKHFRVCAHRPGLGRNAKLKMVRTSRKLYQSLQEIPFPHQCSPYDTQEHFMINNLSLQNILAKFAHRRARINQMAFKAGYLKIKFLQGR